MEIKREMNVKWIPVNELKENPENPNVHSSEQIQELIKIIEFQGWRSPIIVSNQSGMIVVGHGRLEAAKKMNLEKVPVSFQDFDDYDQEFAHMVADNALARLAFLDYSKINESLQNLGPDLDLSLLGIRDFALDPSELMTDPEQEWKGMPEFSQEDGGPFRTMLVHFFDEDGVKDFAKLLNHPVTDKTKYIWFPEAKIDKASEVRYDVES